MIDRGSPEGLGPTTTGDGTNFALFSSVAERVELCLFDTSGNQTSSHDLPDCTDGVWHGFLPGCETGQRYGYRVHGPYDPARGLRCNSQKLLVDPYARRLHGGFQWTDRVFDSNAEDSAGDIPFSVCDGRWHALRRAQTSYPVGRNDLLRVQRTRLHNAAPRT